MSTKYFTAKQLYSKIQLSCWSLDDVRTALFFPEHWSLEKINEAADYVIDQKYIVLYSKYAYILQACFESVYVEVHISLDFSGTRKIQTIKPSWN
jgi:hypothetical protein